MNAVTDFIEILLLLALVASPALVTAVAIIVFYRCYPNRIKASRALPIGVHVAAFIGVSLISSVIGYHLGLQLFCSAHPEPQYECGLAAILFAAPAAFFFAGCMYLVVYVVFGRRNHKSLA